jgi:hypothetical protein
MSDPLSISAAVVGFTAFALEIAKIATEFLKDAYDFPEEFTRLSLAIQEFGILVRRLSPILEKVEKTYGSEDSIPPLSCG